MKKIVTIFTGGTIGSKLTASGEISPDQGSGYRLLEMYQQRETKDLQERIVAENPGNPRHDTEMEESGKVEFITEEPYYILSENLSGKELVLLAQCIEKYISGNRKGYAIDGILIMHGTDTLQYTAAFLDYVFGRELVPVLLVSSAFPLEDKRANGFRNFCSAVNFIQNNCGKGVFVSYANDGETVKIHRGTELVRSMEYSADIYSRDNNFYGSFSTDGVFIKNLLFRESWEKAGRQNGFDFKRMTETCESVLRISSYPGICYPSIPNGIQVVLIESYHSGTIGITEGLKQLMKDANERRIPVYLTGLNEQDADYETVREYRKLGIVPLRNKTAVSQYMKLWLLTSNSREIRENMEGEAG